MQLPDLLVFTDAGIAATHARGVVETIARALAAPAPGVAIVVRAKNQPAAAVRDLCSALLPITTRAGATLIVHTHVHLVADLGLAGAHLSSAADVGAARARLPGGALLGASRHLGDGFDDLDYATLSPVFSPSSKPDDPRPPLGLAALAAAVKSTSVPLYALGGIDSSNVARVRRTGARVAVLGTVMGAHDPGSALYSLKIPSST